MAFASCRASAHAFTPAHFTATSIWQCSLHSGFLDNSVLSFPLPLFSRLLHYVNMHMPLLTTCSAGDWDGDSPRQGETKTAEGGEPLESYLCLASLTRPSLPAPRPSHKPAVPHLSALGSAMSNVWFPCLPILHTPRIRPAVHLMPGRLSYNPNRCFDGSLILRYLLHRLPPLHIQLSTFSPASRPNP